MKKVWIEGMACAHCASRVKTALEAIDGVSNVSVDLEKGAAFFCGDAAQDVIREAIEDAGYDVTRIE